MMLVPANSSDSAGQVRPDKLGFIHAMVALVLAVSLMSVPAFAATWSLDFLTETWDHSVGGGPAASLGWADGELIGSTTINGIGITVEFDSVGNTVGNAHSDNASYRDNPPGFVGFLWGLKSQAGLNTAPTLTNYSTFTITFDQPVSGSLNVADFDERPQWRDAGGFEAFSGAIGGVGTGIAPDIVSLGRFMAVSNSFQIETYLSANIGGQPLGPDNAVMVEWTQPVTVIRGYLYNSQNGPDAGNPGFEFGVGITGSGGNSSPVSIPTISAAGFAILVLMLAGVALIFLRSRA